MRVLIADDHDLLREVFEMWFRKERIEVAAASDLPGAMAAVAGAEPFDLILLDYRMPGMEGLDGLARMLAEGKGARVALMSGNAAPEVVQAALNLGAVGFLPKTLPPRTFIDAVRGMVQGDRFVPEEDRKAPQGRTAHRAEAGVSALAGKLTERERQVLERLCMGRAEADIAVDLGIGQPTARLHLKTLLRKIGAETPAHATQIARQAGLC